MADKIIGKVQAMEGLLTVEQLAERLNVPKSWVYERTRDRTNSGIPRVHVGKYVRFNLSEVIEWLKEHDQ